MRPIDVRLASSDPRFQAMPSFHAPRTAFAYCYSPLWRQQFKANHRITQGRSRRAAGIVVLTAWLAIVGHYSVKRRRLPGGLSAREPAHFCRRSGFTPLIRLSAIRMPYALDVGRHTRADFAGSLDGFRLRWRDSAVSLRTRFANGKIALGVFVQCTDSSYS